MGHWLVHNTALQNFTLCPLIHCHWLQEYISRYILFKLAHLKNIPSTRKWKNENNLVFKTPLCIYYFEPWTTALKDSRASFQNSIKLNRSFDPLEFLSGLLQFCCRLYGKIYFADIWSWLRALTEFFINPNLICKGGGRIFCEFTRGRCMRVFFSGTSTWNP